MSSLNIKKSVLWTCFLLMIYYLIMEIYYFYFIGTSYFRFKFYININEQKYLETKILFIATIFLMVFISRLSEFIYSIFVFFVIFFLIPGFITYSLSDQPAGPLYSTVLLMLAIGTISINKIQVPPLRMARVPHWLTIVMLVIALIPFLYSFGFYFNFHNIVLDDIAKTRGYYDDNSSVIINYLYNWLVKAAIPILMIYFLIHKKHTYAFFSFAILLYLYTISGNKIVYITSFVMVFFFLFGKDYSEKVAYFTLFLIAALLIIPLVDYSILNDHSLKGIFVMRMLFLPSHLNYFYFDFFADKPLYFSESSFFNMFHEYPFNEPVGFVIAKHYFQVDDMNANNGIISDGFMNLGYAGVVVNILLISVIFLFFNSVRPDARYLGIFFVIIFLFLSAPMLSMFITSGLWLTSLFAFNLMRNTEQRN